jgi:hypothetical protein
MIGVTPMEDQEFATGNGNGSDKKLTGGLRR